VGASGTGGGGGRRIPDRHVPADPLGRCRLKLSSLVLQAPPAVPSRTSLRGVPHRDHQ